MRAEIIHPSAFIILHSPYGFTGEWTDATGLVYLRARYYAPWQGRFLSRDGWGGDVTQPLSYNKWLYVYGNPVNRVDPQGLFPCSVCPYVSSGWAYEMCMKYCCDEATPTSIDCNQLPGGAPAMCKTYLALRNHPGWWSKGSWNGYRSGPLSPQAFLGLLLRMEFNGFGGTGFNNVDFTIQQEAAVRNFYAHCPYWSGCLGDSRSADDIFIYLDHKRLLWLRPQLILPQDADSATIAAVWKDDPAYSNADFEYGFLHPGAWVDGWGPCNGVTESGRCLYTAPMDWGNISMIRLYDLDKYAEAWNLTNPPNGSPDKATGLAEDRFFIARGYGDTATIQTLSQRRYWRGS